MKRAVAEARAQHGPLQVLVSNAGITRDGLLVGMQDGDLRDVVETNLMGAVNIAREAVPDMIRARWGRMVFMSSTTSLSGAPGQTDYAASKAGLVGFARSLAREVGRRRVTVNIVAPGLIETDMAKNVTRERREQVLSQTWLNRTGTPEEVAHAVRFLTSEEASYVTGAIVPVTGGLGVGH